MIGEIGRRIAKLAGANVVAQVLTLLAAPIITRLYLPSEMGTAALLFSLTGFFGTLLLLRYEHAYMLVDQRDEELALTRLVLRLALVMLMLATATAAAVMIFEVLGYGYLPLWSLLFLVPLVFMRGLTSAARQVAVRDAQVGLIARAVLVGAAVLVGTRIVAGLFDAGLHGLLISRVLGIATTVAILAWPWLKPYWHAGLSRASGVAEVARRYRNFPTLEAPGLALNLAARLLPLPIIAAVYGTTEAGLFGLVFNVVFLPSRHVRKAIADVYHGEAAALVRKGDAVGLVSLTGMFFRRLLLLGLLMLPAIIVLAPMLFGPIFGEQWASAGDIAVLFSPWLFAALLVVPISRVLSLLQRQDLKLFYDTITLVSILLGYWLAQHYQWTFDSFLVYLSATQFVFYGLYGLFVYNVLRSYVASSGRGRDELG